MSKATWAYYDGNSSGPALVLPPGESDGKADLYVIPENGEPGYTVRDVPRRDKGAPEGTGHTFRDEK